MKKLINRRSFLIGLIAAPVIIRAGILMPIKVIEPVKTFTLQDYYALMNKIIKECQDQISDSIMYRTDYYYGGLKFFVKENKIESERINIVNMIK